jgi:hypothetical protein
MQKRKFSLLETVYFEQYSGKWSKTYIVSTLPKLQSDFYLIAEYGPRVHESKLRSEIEHNKIVDLEAGL